MPRKCTVCLHARRQEIDAVLVSGAAANRAIARQYGLTHHAIGRHEGKHLPEALMAGHEAARKAQAKTLRARVDKLCTRLEALADRCLDHGSGDDLLKTARELRPTLELLGRATGEIATSNKQLFINLGVRDEAEIRRALELTRAGAELTLEEVRAEVFETLRLLLAQRPEWYYDARDLIESASRVEVLESANGHRPG